MTVIIVKRLSKKNTEYVALVVNGVIVTFDTMTICRVANISPRTLDDLRVGDTINLMEGGNS